jgi:HD-GYP domain-containing protein (c-di-GMP phosphodiesterase class II)
MGLDPQSLDDIVLAAGLQDIGMLSVAESILEKTSPLTPEEWAELKRHPVVGEEIVAAATSLSDVAALVRSSYERFDGSGYPDGLAGHEIPLGARIIAPCVALAAMLCHRPHRPPLSPAEAAAELRAGSGTQFDPRVVAALLTEELSKEEAPSFPGPGQPGGRVLLPQG